MYKTKRNFSVRNDDLIFDMLRMWNSLSSVFDPLHDEMTRNYNMLVSKLQWKEEWRAELEAAGRSTFSYNLLRKVVNSLLGADLESRKQIVAKAKGAVSDPKMAQIVTQILLHFTDNTNFDWHKTRVMIDTIIAKFGVYNVGWSYEDDPEGELYIKAIDPRRIRFELNYADPNWEETGYIFDKHQLSLEEILDKYALNDLEMQNILIEEAKVFFEEEYDKKKKWISRKLKSIFNAAFEVVTGTQRARDNNFSQFLNWWDPLTGKFDVLELHEKRTERRLLIAEPIPGTDKFKHIDITDETRAEDGINFDRNKISFLKEQYKLKGEPKVDLDNVKFMTAVVPAFYAVVNEQPYPFKMKGFTYVPNFCYDYHPDPYLSQSVIDDLIDPQSDYNKARNMKLELLYRYVNSGWVMDENAIIGVEEDWETNRLAPYRRVRSGYMGLIKPEDHQTISADLIRETAEAPQLIEQISNVGPQMAGPGEREKSGKLFRYRESTQIKSFSYLFSNRDNATTTVASRAWTIIQAMVQTSRLFRITVDDPELMTEKEIEIAVNQKMFGFDPKSGMIIKKIKNDITIGDYDFSLGKANYNAYARELEFLFFSELFEAVSKVNPNKADAMLPYLVKIGGFPYADQVVQKWASMEGPDPQMQAFQDMMLKIQQIMAKLGIEEKKEDILGKQLDNAKKKEELKRMAKENILGTLKKKDSMSKDNMLSQFQFN